MMLTLNDFLAHDSSIVRDVAKELLQYQDELKSGAITDAEYLDLCQDLTSLHTIEELSNKIEERQMLQSAFEAMLKIASVASSL
jgi:regulator of sigma D